MNEHHHGDPDQLRPRRTHRSNQVWKLPGGTEDNDLWTEVTRDEDSSLVVCSTFVPTAEQRARIAAGENIELRVWGGQPPVAVTLTDVPLGKPPIQPPV